MNQLYYDDNLEVLREHITNESVDLLYLDQQFRSKLDCNLFFKSPRDVTSEAQIEALTIRCVGTSRNACSVGR
jgi:hypothetical protein